MEELLTGATWVLGAAVAYAVIGVVVFFGASNLTQDTFKSTSREGKWFIAMVGLVVSVFWLPVLLLVLIAAMVAGVAGVSNAIRRWTTRALDALKRAVRAAQRFLLAVAVGAIVFPACYDPLTWGLGGLSIEISFYDWYGWPFFIGCAVLFRGVYEGLDRRMFGRQPRSPRILWSGAGLASGAYLGTIWLAEPLHTDLDGSQLFLIDASIGALGGVAAWGVEWAWGVAARRLQERIAQLPPLLLPGVAVRRLGGALVGVGLAAVVFSAVWPRVVPSSRAEIDQAERPKAIRPALVQIPRQRDPFLMGSGEGGEPDEQPRRMMVLGVGFLMGETEVTREQYEAVTGEDPPGISGCLDCPVEGVSWYDAVDYANALSEREGLAPCYTVEVDEDGGERVEWPSGLVCAGYRLPTEAEWEYAARAGTTTAYFWGESGAEPDVKAYAWYERNAQEGAWTEPRAAREGAQPVGQKAPNRWGLRDIAGNVGEWCWDRYAAYDPSDTVNAQGPSEGAERVFRGGTWGAAEGELRSAARHAGAPGGQFAGVGFRVVRTVDLRRAFLQAAELAGLDLAGADLRGADLRGADLRGADLRGADLRGVSLARAHLGGADLSGADLQNAELKGVLLGGADLRGAKLGGAQWDEAVYSGATRWPEEVGPPREAVFLDFAPE